MASIRIIQFAGIRPELSARLKPATNAQIAHNCLLTDGSLRPQTTWAKISEYISGAIPDIRGVAFDWTNDAAFLYASFDPVTLEGEPFIANTTVGASPNSLVNRYLTGSGLSPATVAVYGGGVSATVLYVRAYDSIKPVNRLYALSRVRRSPDRLEEGSLIPVTSGQSPTDVLYEGDLVNVEINATTLDDGATNVRIYRSITGLDTGDNVTNQFDTNWHLVSELPLIGGNLLSYVDGASATALPLDVCYSQNFHPPQIPARYFGLSEGGWFVTASIAGEIQVSERYMHHAWPIDNHMRLQGEEITDIAIHRDNVYVGTLRKPYIVSLAAGEAGLQASATDFGESIPCLPGSMAAAASGAIYASGQGLIALSREGQQNISRDVANAGDVLYSTTLPSGEVSKASIANTSFGTYYQGVYIGFCEGPALDDGIYYTTTVYPLESLDSMRSTSEMVSSLNISVVLDQLAITSTFMEGELRPIRQETNMDDRMYVTSMFVEGELYSIHKYGYMEDAIVPNGFIAQAYLVTNLINNDAVQPISADGVLISGTLT